MSTIDDLPSSAGLLVNTAANGMYQGGFDGSGRQEEISWAVPWEDRFAFEQAVVGIPEPITIGNRTITRRVPLQDPWNPGLYAIGVRFKAQGKANVTPDRPHNTIIYSVTFGILPYGTDGDAAFQTLQAQGASRQITIPNSRYVFSNGEVVDHGIAVNHPGTTYQFTQFQISNPAAFDQAMIDLMENPVNATPLSIAGRTFPAGTILVETYSTQETLSLFGTKENQASIVLVYSSLPWNSMVRSDGQVDVLTPQQYGVSDLSTMIY